MTGHGTDTSDDVPVTTLHDPSHRESLWALEEAFDRGDLVTVFGQCSVEYDGRAASSLGPGQRLLVLKPDGAALVHTDEGRTPVNWQPSGSEHQVAIRDGYLQVRSVRSTPDESLSVLFTDVAQVSALSVSGSRDVTVEGKEEDLRQLVLEDPSLIESGFEPKAVERPTSAGPVDVFGRDGEGRLVILELKRRRVGPAAVGQLARYVSAVEREETVEDAVRGILVAPSVTDRAAALLTEEGLEYVPLAPDQT